MRCFGVAHWPGWFIILCWGRYQWSTQGISRGSEVYAWWGGADTRGVQKHSGSLCCSGRRGPAHISTATAQLLVQGGRGPVMGWRLQGDHEQHHDGRGGALPFFPWEAKSLPTRALLGAGPRPKARGNGHSIRPCCLQGTFLQLRHRELAAALLLAP